MEIVKNVDNFIYNIIGEYVFQQIIIIYTHLHKKTVDNVEKFNHIKKVSKIKTYKQYQKSNAQCLHKVIHMISTKCG